MNKHNVRNYKTYIALASIFVHLGVGIILECVPQLPLPFVLVKHVALIACGFFIGFWVYYIDIEKREF